MDGFFKLLTITFFIAFSSAFSAIVDTSKSTFYLYSYFEDGSAGEAAGTFLMISNDGINWDYCNNRKPIITPLVGSEKLMRDPCLYYAADSTFHLVWTTAWAGKDIGYAYSKDLFNWSEQKALSVMSNYPNTAMCWAPEIFYNDLKQEYMIYWSSDPDGANVNGDIKKTFYSTTKDFKTFSIAKELFSQNYSEIDATLLKTGEGSYKLFFKDERINDNVGRIIYCVNSSTPEGPWSSVSAGITKRGVEGPTAIKIGNEYRVYFDPYSYSDNKYRYVKSTNLTDWTDGTPFSASYRHGTILQIPKNVALWLLYKIPLQEIKNPGIENLTHQWTFDNGTANDLVGTANGILRGGAAIENKALKTSADGQYLELPADKINIASYSALSMEIWFTEQKGKNAVNAMLCYFGNTVNHLGSNGCFISTGTANNSSKAAISCGNETAPWEVESYVYGVKVDDGQLHQMVSVISTTNISFYVDGNFIGSTTLNSGNSIANINQNYAYLAKSGYNADPTPTWLGSIDKFNLYNKALSAGEVLYLYQNNIIPKNPGTDNLKHQWNFNNGTANDLVGTADGILRGGAAIENKALKTSADGQYLELPADKIGIASYPALSMEIWFTEQKGKNAVNTMLCYFGNTVNHLGSNGCFISTGAVNNSSKAAISCGNETAPWEAESYVYGVKVDDGQLHQMVSVISTTNISFYIDGNFIGSTTLNSGNSIANINQNYAYLAKSGYNADPTPTWLGSIDKFSLYNKSLSAGEVIYLYQSNLSTDVKNNKINPKSDFISFRSNSIRFLGKSIATPLNAERTMISVFNLKGELISQYNLAQNTPFTQYPNNSIAKGMYIVRLAFYNRSGSLISSESLKGSFFKNVFAR